MKNQYIVEAVIIDENTHNYYAQYQGQTYCLAKEDHPNQLSLNDKIEGFIYEDKDHQLRIQTKIPEIIQQDFAWGNVVGSLDHLGVFVDVGLRNKDIVISIDDLPLAHENWPQEDDQLYISLEIDDKGRFWGKIANREEIKPLVKIAPPRLMNQNINVRIFTHKGVGFAGLSSEGFITFIHESELTRGLRIGEEVEVRVIAVHPDGRLNGSMRPRAFEALDDDAAMIQAVLSKSPNKYVPLHDKSDPADILAQFSLSKSQFKRAVGRLMKHGIVEQKVNDGIYLIDKDVE